jgi:tetratricopeptide (TPR) repeat protein
VLGDVENSLFTHYMIEGLRTGGADRDEDGLITIDELYDYVYEHVLNETPKQTPGKWAYGQQGEIVIAQNPNATGTKLPPEIEETLASKLPSVRMEAVKELENILRGRNETRAKLARDRLKRLTEDDSRRVASAAADILKAFEGDLATERLEIERLAADRAAHVAELVTRAQSSIERGNLDEAETPLAEALGFEPEDPEALRVQDLLRQRIAERIKLEQAEQSIRELRQRISELIARANATEDHDAAIDLLNEALGLDPEHAEVRELLEDRHRQRDEEERRDRDARLLQHLADARTALAENRFADAATALARAAKLDPESREIESLIKAAEEGKAAAEAEQQRQEQNKRQVAEAKAHLSKGDLTQAIVITDLILQNDPENDAALALHGKVQQAIEVQKEAEQRAMQARERRRQIDDAIHTAEETPGDDTAIEMLQDVLVRDPDNERAIRLLRKRTEERRLQIKREAERIARRERIDGLMATARDAMAHRRYEDALAALDEIRSIDGQAAGADELRKSAEAALQQQQAAILAEQRIAEALRRAEKRFRRRDRSGALQFVEQALAIDPQHARALAVREEIRRAPDVPPSHTGQRLIKIAAGVIVAAGLSVAGWALWQSGGTQPPRTSSASVVSPAPPLVAPTRGSTTPEEKTPSNPTAPAPATADARADESKSTARGDEARNRPEAAGETAPSTGKSEAPTAGTSTAAVAEPTKSEPVRNEAAAAVEEAARRYLRAGRLRDAAAALDKGLAADPNDAGLKDALRNIQNEARRRSLRAMNDVEKAGMPAIGSKAFADGKRLHADGEAMQAAGKASVAVNDFMTAVQLFGQALQAVPTSAQASPHVTAPLPGTTTATPSYTPGGGRSAPTNPDSATAKSPSTAATEKPTAAPKAAEPSPPAPMSPPATAAATPMIMKLVRQYASATENRDMNKLKGIWAGMSSQTERQLRRQWEDYRSIQVEISNCSAPTFSYNSQNTPVAAAITCHEKNKIDTRVSGRIDSQLLTTFVFRTVGPEWAISEVSKRPFDGR